MPATPFRTAAFALLAALCLTPTASAQDGRALWTDLATADVALVGERVVAPEAFRAVHLYLGAMAALVAEAPSGVRFAEGMTLALPLPEGGFARFAVVERSVMAPGLQARYPAIRAYAGVGLDEPGATVRFTVTPLGFHAAARTAAGTFYVDPYSHGDRERYTVYRRADLPANPSRLVEDVVVEEAAPAGGEAQRLRVETTDLRTYRAAIAATGEYTNFHGGTVAAGLAAINVALARVNEIYEREVGITMVLVEDNDEIVYTNAGSDPYTNFSGFTLLGENQSNLDSVIGAANYDIGHVFSTGGGGVASLGSVCRAGVKARGVTGLPSPTGDPFYVDYVAHEMGHQYRGNHTFNGTAGSCAGGNRNPSTAYEPGSGSTIMAYAGICRDFSTGENHNVQTRSDDYFHNVSINEIVSYTRSSFGNDCGEVTDFGNAAPEVTVEASLAIPSQTPFFLTGSATDDGDDDLLTYTWEERDLGPAGPPPGRPSWDDTAPFFRSYGPSPSPTRFFPRQDIYALGFQPGSERLPVAGRLLNFRFTVRDNNPGAGAVKDAAVVVSVEGDAGPFVVTSQSEGDPSWAAGEQHTITWDVANTDTEALGGEDVDILLSLDREKDFVAGTAVVLASATPNDGSETITVPAGIEASRARVYVRASDGLFFDLNDEDIAVSPTVASEDGARTRAAELSPAYPNPLGLGGQRASVNLSVERAQAVRVAVYDALGRSVLVLHEGPLAASRNHQFAVRSGDLAAGTYFVRAEGEAFQLTRPLTVVR